MIDVESVYVPKDLRLLFTTSTTELSLDELILLSSFGFGRMITVKKRLKQIGDASNLKTHSEIWPVFTEREQSKPKRKKTCASQELKTLARADALSAPRHTASPPACCIAHLSIPDEIRS